MSGAKCIVHPIGTACDPQVILAGNGIFVKIIRILLSKIGFFQKSPLGSILLLGYLAATFLCEQMYNWRDRRKCCPAQIPVEVFIFEQKLFHRDIVGTAHLRYGKEVGFFSYGCTRIRFYAEPLPCFRFFCRQYNDAVPAAGAIDRSRLGIF
ncbi:hypothetical protein D3C80_717500 [compost metagenome]